MPFSSVLVAVNILSQGGGSFLIKTGTKEGFSVCDK